MRSSLPHQLSKVAQAAAISAPLLLLLLAGSLQAQMPLPSETNPNSIGLLTLDDCIAIALENQPAIAAERSAVCAAVERRKIAGSYFLPSLDFQARYTHIDEPRSVDFPAPFAGQVGDVFSDAGAFFGIARQLGTAAASAALNNPDAPMLPGGLSFNDVQGLVRSSLPDRFNVGLVGENSLTTDFLLVQPLWTGGKIRYRHQQAELGVRAASADVAKSKQQTVFEVTRAYLGAQLAGELTAVIEDTIGHLRAIESLIKALLDVGDQYVTVVDLHRAGAFRLLAESEQVRVDHASQLALEALRQAMGLDRTVDFDVADPHLVARQQPLRLPVILDQAMIRRPELAKARLAVRIAELERDLATANYLPDVALFGRFATIDDDGGFANPNDRQEWAAGLTLGLPLYQGGRRPARKRQAEFQQARAGHVRQLARQLITLEVQKAYLDYLETEKRLTLAANAVDQADLAIQGLRNQFLGDSIKDEDMPDYFEDMLNARLLHTRARTSYYDNVCRYNLSLAKIRLATASDEYQGLLGESLGATVGVSDRGGTDHPGGNHQAARGPALFERDGRRQ